MATRYSKQASRKVAEVMRERKEGKLRSGSTGKKVTSRKQAIAIGLAEARREGAQVPARKTSRKTASGKRSTDKKTSARKKTAARKKTSSKKAARRKIGSTRKSD